MAQWLKYLSHRHEDAFQEPVWMLGRQGGTPSVPGDPRNKQASWTVQTRELWVPLRVLASKNKEKSDGGSHQISSHLMPLHTCTHTEPTCMHRLTCTLHTHHT